MSISAVAVATLSALIFTARPHPQPQRAEEDWSVLRARSAHEAPLDGLKYVPLGAPDYYLTLGGQARTVYELFVREFYARVPQDDSGSWLLRTTAHADVHLGPHARTFLELRSAVEMGRDGGPTPFDRDALDVHQAFAEFRAGDARNRDGLSAVLRVGRQELLFGAGRLYDLRDGPSTRRSFDAARVRFNAPWLVAEAFAGQEVSVLRGVLDNDRGGRPRTWGVHATTRPGVLGRFGADAYYLAVDQSGLAYTSGVGEEVRHSIGGRWWAATPNLRHDLELTYQFGALTEPEGRRVEIRAWGIAASAEYTWDPTGLRPTLSLGGGITSGDQDPGDDRLQTFRSPFPNLRFAGATTLLGPSNMWGVNPGFSISPLPRRLMVAATTRFFWRTETRDSVYSPGGFGHAVSPEPMRFAGLGGTVIGIYMFGNYLSAHVMLEAFRPTRLLTLDAAPEVTLFTQVGGQLVF